MMEIQMSARRQALLGRCWHAERGPGLARALLRGSHYSLPRC